MRKLAHPSMVVLLCCVLSLTLGAQTHALRPGYHHAAQNPEEQLYLPFKVTTPDGLALEAGAYRVTVHQPMLQMVSRAAGSLGRWPGPRVRLQRIHDPLPPLAVFTLKTAFPVWVVYSPPGRWQQQRVRAATAEPAPFIRDRQLVGIVYRGRILYVTEARQEHNFGKPHKR